MSVSNYENLLSNAERRGVVQGQSHVVARPSDLAHAAAGGRGKVEMSMTEEPGEEDGLLDRMTDEAVKNVFDQYLKPKRFRSVVEHVEAGNTIRVGEGVTTDDYLTLLDEIPKFREDVAMYAEELEPALADGPHRDQLLACVAEFILEGLHVHNRLNRARTGAVASYGG